ncbi:MAG: aspartate/glutamate racemase family protein [Candidatus Thermoplasmatota archaeon]
MRTIGLVGGMSWESTAEYYRIINETVKERLGGLHSAKIVIYSLDFAEIDVLQREERWTEAAGCMIEASKCVERAGADFILLCTNTMHKVADEVSRAVALPLLHIADATGEEVLARGIKKVGLLGTIYTMEQEFYKDRLTARYGLEVLTPNPSDRKRVHELIYNELCLGEIRESSRTELRRIIEELVKEGAEGIVLGCTELPLLVRSQDSTVPLFDTTRIHAQKAVEMALRNF